MVVDYDPGIRSKLKWGLDEYEVIASHSRIDAVDKFLKYNPHIVTLDLGLPPDEVVHQKVLKCLKRYSINNQKQKSL